MSDNIRIAVLGLGRLGMIHAENLSYHINGAQLACVVDAYGNRAEQAAKELKVERWEKDPDIVFSDPTIDGVVIATPTSTHFEMTKRAAQNKKHIFVEKPITETLEEATELIETIKENNVHCQVGFMRRFHPEFVEAKKRIEAGEIGKPIYFKGFTRDNPPDKYDISPSSEFLKRSGGIFLDLAIHDYDIARYLMEADVTSILADGRVVMNPFMEAYGDVDQAITYMEFDSGATGDIESSRTSPYGFDIGCEVIGTEGAIQIASIQEKQATILKSSGKTEPSSIFPPSMHKSYQFELKDFIHSIKNNAKVLCNAEDGKAALKLSIAANESYKTGKKIKIYNSSLVSN